MQVNKGNLVTLGFGWKCYIVLIYFTHVAISCVLQGTSTIYFASLPLECCRENTGSNTSIEHSWWKQTPTSAPDVGRQC